jgi:hypothetical protein
MIPIRPATGLQESGLNVPFRVKLQQKALDYSNPLKLTHLILEAQGQKTRGDAKV